MDIDVSTFNNSVSDMRIATKSIRETEERVNGKFASELQAARQAAGIGGIVTIYIDNENSSGNASDDNPGTHSEPLLNMSAAKHKFLNGHHHRIVLMGGCLVDSIVLNFFINGSFEFDSDIDKFKADGSQNYDEYPVLRMGGCLSGSYQYNKHIFINKVRLHLRKIDKSDGNTLRDAMFQLRGGSSFLTAYYTHAWADEAANQNLIAAGHSSSIDIYGKMTGMDGHFIQGIAAGEDVRTKRPDILTNLSVG